MNDNLKELLILNRMLIFNKLITDNLIKSDIYVDKIQNDTKFIGHRIESLFESIYNNPHDLKKYNKVYCNVFKKYYLFIDSLITNKDFMDNSNFDYKTLMNFYRDTKDHYEKIKNISNTEKKNPNNTQYINENEYTLLLSQLEE